MLKSLSLEGSRALVTGSGTGIGRQIALGFAEAGAELILVGRRLEPLQDTANIAREKFGDVQITLVAADVTLDEGIEKIAEQAGQVDVLCNNAGASDWGPWQSISLDKWRNTFAVNVEGPFRLCQIFAPKMMERRYGRIINIGSVYGSMGGNPALYPGLDWDIAPYFASKHAVHGITHYLAPRLAPFGTTINTLSPGGFAGSEMNEKAGTGTDAQLNAFYDQVPMRRLGGSDDISAAAVFLASQGSKYMTGQNVIVDGGWSIW
ncbi:MAG: SDR family oxidoreductase [Actinobacteria bacterium]|nr:SDR family oxidoreductase [Actinomycetota bacterium]